MSRFNNEREQIRTVSTPEVEALINKMVANRVTGPRWSMPVADDPMSKALADMAANRVTEPPVKVELDPEFSEAFKTLNDAQTQRPAQTQSISVENDENDYLNTILKTQSGQIRPPGPLDIELDDKNDYLYYTLKRQNKTNNTNERGM